MVTSAQALKKYGPASNKNPWLQLYDIPVQLQAGNIPKRVFCNKDLIGPLLAGFKNLIERGFVSELVTWDGSFNIRTKRGQTSASLHSWAIAFDVNAATNGLNKTPTLSAGFVKCFTDVGFDWGGFWKKPIDGMHFQLAKI